MLVAVAVTLFYHFRPMVGPGVSVDLPQVTYPQALQPKALRRNAMHIAVLRDGRIIFGSEWVRSEEIPALIRKSVAAGAERKVYIKADRSAEYGNVARVAEAVRASGIQDIVFVTEDERGFVTPD